MKEKIGTITCKKCKKEFDVNTEDLEWHHLTDHGEREDDPCKRDFATYQKVRCPHCNTENEVLVKAVGESSDKIESVEVISMEIDVLIDEVANDDFNNTKN